MSQKEHINIGTIGHVDHGKTTLTAALTAVQAARVGGTAKSYDEIAKASEAQGRRGNFLKISLSLELDDANDIPRVEAVLPRIVDAFQSYLRELRPEDLRGSSGMYRLREELLARVNASAQPAKVNDVLFKEMLVQ